MWRPFTSWIEVLEYLVFLCMGIAGMLDSSWLWPVNGALVLLLLRWSRFRDLFATAGRLDARYRELARLERASNRGTGFALYGRARLLPTVLAMKIGHDCLFTSCAFLSGLVAAWLWALG